MNKQRKFEYNLGKLLYKQFQIMYSKVKKKPY